VGQGSAREPRSSWPDKGSVHSCGRRLDGLQLICISLGVQARTAGVSSSWGRPPFARTARALLAGPLRRGGTRRPPHPRSSCRRGEPPSGLVWGGGRGRASRDPAGPTPNPEMQPTSRTIPSSARALTAAGAQRNKGLCGRRLDGLQLISIPLGGRHRSLRARGSRAR
jgi:hypothetical protein